MVDRNKLKNGGKGSPAENELKITLLDSEQSLFTSLLNFATEFHPTTTLRVAGGWVRDKLLGHTSYDLDIVLDNITGLEFAQSFSNFLSLNTHVIKANPDKSKHLETAVLKVGDLMIDFVQLRSESYANSRIPTIKVGSALEDAKRRDLTINSLFYNLNTKTIEDFTGFGIDDLKNKILRTPICPIQTFLDDPLRILRVLRFKARLNFKVADEIYTSVSKEALKTKVSNERVGVEINKIVHSEFGMEAMDILFQMGIHEEVFKPGIQPYIKEFDYVRELRTILNELEVDFDLVLPSKDTEVGHINAPSIQENRGSLSDNIASTSSLLIIDRTPDRLVSSDCSILILYRVLIFYCLIKKDTKDFINNIIVKESLKWTNRLERKILAIEENVEYLLTEKEDFLKIARKIGNMNSDHTWRISIIICMIYCRLKGLDSTHCKNIYTKIRNNQHWLTVTPLVNGNDVILFFKGKKSQIKEIIEDGILYQMKSGMVKKDEVIEYLKNKYC